ncbi:HD domain-containing protein [Candidatus Woesearchaeota archaeon]|nr:MAG: HD domain-containing protein [Candidatus Woesearchaeota archaeon]
MNKKEAVNLLRKYAPNKHVFRIVLDHSKAVQKLAVSIAKKANADVEFVKTASLLHDIGRFRFPPGPESIKHGIAGGKILRKEGFPELARVAERHLGAGILKKEIIEKKLPLPKKDYVPRTIEEKIISYADNLVYGKTIKTSEWAVKRFRNEIGRECAQRTQKLNEEIKSLINKNKKQRK